MNRSTNRLAAVTAGMAAFGLVLTGCGTGQVTQTSTQESGVNGNAANLKDIALRNVHLQAVQTTDFLEPGSAVELMFVAANNSPDVNDTLRSITSEVGTVTMTGSGAVPAGGALIVGSPDGQDVVTPAGSEKPATAEVTLDAPITNGLTYNFTFDFEKAGKATVAVPISAGESSRQG